MMNSCKHPTATGTGAGARPEASTGARGKISGGGPAPTNQLSLFDAISMDSDTQYVLSIIRGRVGRKSAISVTSISERTAIPPRTVRDIVKNLIEHHHVRIGSALGRPSGYYMIETKEEAEQNEHTLRKLGVSILVRAAVLKKLTIQEYMRQLQIEMPL